MWEQNSAYDSCTLTGSWPSASYARTVDASSNVTTTATDALGRTTRYIKNAGYGALQIKRPGAATDNVVVSYDGVTGRVASVAREGVTASYAYADAGTTRTTTVTDPNGNAR